MVSNFLIGTSLEIVIGGGQRTVSSQWISSHRFSCRYMGYILLRYHAREALIKSLSDFTLEFLCIARNNLTRIASYLRKVMTKLCIKILVKSDSAI